MESKEPKDQQPVKKSDKSAKDQDWGKKVRHGAWELLQFLIAAVLLYYIVNFLDLLIK